jgi:hypothetical protein
LLKYLDSRYFFTTITTRWTARFQKWTGHLLVKAQQQVLSRNFTTNRTARFYSGGYNEQDLDGVSPAALQDIIALS